MLTPNNILLGYMQFNSALHSCGSRLSRKEEISFQTPSKPSCLTAASATRDKWTVSEYFQIQKQTDLKNPDILLVWVKTENRSSCRLPDEGRWTDSHRVFTSFWNLIKTSVKSLLRWKQTEWEKRPGQLF